MDTLFTFLLIVSANVLSELIIDWLKELRNDEKSDDKKDER